MAIAVPNDVVLGVARAADPSAYEAAVARLTALKSSTPTAVAAKPGSSFADAIAASNPDAPPPAATGMASLASSTAPTGTRAVADKTAAPYKQFESFVLQTFIEAMLPQDAESVFGGGIAGQYWKSMMAEKLAGELAESGGVGIARQLAAEAAKATKAQERDKSQAPTLTDAT